MITRNELAVVVVLAVLAIAGPAHAQVPENNAPGYTVTVDAPGSATKCQEIEVVLDINAQPGGGTESVHVEFGGMVFSRSYCEKLEWGPAGPDHSCNVWYGIEHWGGSNAYRGKIHAFFIVTASPPAQAYVQALYGPHENGSLFASAASFVSVAGLGGAVNVNVASLPKSIPADGASTATISVSCLDASCNGLGYRQGTLSTSKGTLSAGSSQGPSVTFSTDGSGVGSATLIADTTPGTATVTASLAGGSGSATVDMVGRRLRLAVSPAAIPADGTSTSLLTATLDDGTGQGVAGESIALTTNLGTLVGGGQTGNSISVQTNSLGDAVANLKSASSAGTAAVTAAYTAGSWNLSDSKDVTFEGYTLEYSETSCLYLNVAGMAGGEDGKAQAGIVSNTSLVATRYGSTKVRAKVVLSFPAGASSPSVAGKTINLRSPEQAALGTGYIVLEQSGSPVTSVTTNADGKAAVDIVVRDLWQAAAAAPTKITVIAELAEDTTITTSLVIDVKDNFDEVLERYGASSLIGDGPVLDDEVIRWVNLNLIPAGVARFNALAGWPGLQNDVMASGAYGVYPGGNDPFVKHTAPWYQHQILLFFHEIQWGPLASPGYADDRWLLNGLDWGPLFVEGGIHVAVVLYPRTSDGSWGTEFDERALQARILDPWPTQHPGNSVYTWSQWKDLLADPVLRRAGEGVKVQTYEFIEGQFGGDNGPSSHYPPNKTLIPGFVGFYYGYSEDVPLPYDPMNRSNWLATYVYSYQTIFKCPVYVTITDVQGRKSGYAPPPAAEPLVDQIPETYRTLLKQADGTLVWTFAMPIAPLTITIVAYGDGPMTASVIDPVRGVEWEWQTNVMTGETATISLNPSSATAPPLVFSGGRTVAPHVSPVLKTGVFPATGKAIGGTAISVTGIEVQAGATVTIGGVAVTNVQYVHGTALTAVTGKAVRVGPVDVEVANPGAQPVTLVKAFTYEMPSGLVDLNADGLGDIVFYKPESGKWAMTKADGQGGFGASVGQWAPGWTIEAGDFSGDGATDLFFYNVDTGAWYVGLNDGQGQYAYTPGSWAAGWEVQVLDLSGDGLADVLVYNKVTGAWYQCLTTTPGTFAYHGGAWSPGWELVPADLNGDGVADLFVYNRTTGAWFRCLSDGAGGFTYVGGAWSPGWEMVAGDFDGDGLSDLLVYNVATGAWYRCHNTGADFTYTPGQWAAGWTLHVGDFNGDGRADVFAYDPQSGAWYVCLHTAAGAFEYHGGSWSPGWQVHVMELTGDGKSDLLVYNPETGAHYQCLTTATPGVFTYMGGQWDAGWTLITGVGR